MTDHQERLPSGGARPRQAGGGLAVGAALCTAAVFLPALANGFIDWDDGSLLLRNPWYRGLGPSNLAWMFTTVRMGHWMPLNWLSFGLDYLAWGMRPLGYHLTSVMLHSAGAAVFYLVARRLLRAALPGRAPDDRWLAWGALAAALAWAIHPLRVESVAWITERRDVLSGLFYLSSVLLYLRYAETRAGRVYWAAVGCFALALMSKSITASLPGVLLVMDVYPLRRLGGSVGWITPAARRVWLEKLPFAALAVAMVAVAFWALASGGGLTPLRALDVPARMALSVYALAFYLGKTLWPVTLSPLYELALPISPLETRFLAGALGAAAATVGAALFRRRWPGLLAAWVAFVLTLLPVLGVAHNGYQLAADRYTYLAELGLALCVGGVVAVFRLPGASAAALVLALWSVLTWQQVGVWRSDETLWRHAAKVDPVSGVARSNLGAALTAGHRYAEAVSELEQAVARRPRYAEAWNNLGLALAGAGHPEEAAARFRHAAAIRPRFAEAWNNLGVSLAVQGRRASAMDAFAHAALIDPSMAEARNNLGLALAEEGKLAEAAEEFRQAVALNPAWQDPRRNLEQALRLLGR